MPTDAVAFSSTHFGVGAGPIHLDNVDCKGNESKLVDCSHGSFVSCFRRNAGVRCQGIINGNDIISGTIKTNTKGFPRFNG